MGTSSDGSNTKTTTTSENETSKVKIITEKDAEANGEVTETLLEPDSIDETDALPANLRYSNFDLFCTSISIFTYLFDLVSRLYFHSLFILPECFMLFQVMDVIVAYYFYHLGAEHGIYHYWYFGLTLTFVLLPSLTMTGFSLRWYLMDAENSQLPTVSLWRWIVRILVLIFQVSEVIITI